MEPNIIGLKLLGECAAKNDVLEGKTAPASASAAAAAVVDDDVVVRRINSTISISCVDRIMVLTDE